MKIGRVEYSGETFYVKAIKDDTKMLRIDGNIFGNYRVTDNELCREEVRFLVPVDYSHRREELVQVYCFGNSFTMLSPTVADLYIKEADGKDQLVEWSELPKAAKESLWELAKLTEERTLAALKLAGLYRMEKK